LCTTRVGIQALSPSSGQALFWISPSVAVAVLVGLGLDYDIFLMDSVMEHWQSGKDGKSAVVTSLDQAGTIISAAGVIMFLAFGALLASTTPVLNQIGFMLCVGVLLDCFVTTKVTIPCLMALVPDDANFWPLKQSATRELAIGREPSFGLEGEISRDCPRLSSRGREEPELSPRGAEVASSHPEIGRDHASSPQMPTSRRPSCSLAVSRSLTQPL